MPTFLYRAEAPSTAPPQRVWEVLLDGRRWAEWNAGVAWMALEGTPGPGTLLTMKPRRGPQTAFRVETFEPARLLQIVVTFGPLASLRFAWTLEPHGSGTRIAQALAVAGPFAGLLLRRRAEAIAAAMPANLERLAARAEHAT